MKNKTNLVYLATPYSHNDPEIMEQRVYEVNRLAGKLLRKGILIFSPISHMHAIAKDFDLNLGWDFWRDYDLTMLHICSKLIVYMQDGWIDSVGVIAEIRFAESIGIPIEYMEKEKNDTDTSKC